MVKILPTRKPEKTNPISYRTIYDENLRETVWKHLDKYRKGVPRHKRSRTGTTVHTTNDFVAQVDFIMMVYRLRQVYVEICAIQEKIDASPEEKESLNGIVQEIFPECIPLISTKRKTDAGTPVMQKITQSHLESKGDN